MFNLSHYFCSFNSLQISVKVKWLNSKKNPWRRIEFLFKKKAPLHNKSWSIYCEVLSVTWPNFTVVKWNLKTSNNYHNIKFGKSIMNREKYNVLKNLAIFTEKHLCWSLSFNENVGLQSCNFIKKDSKTGVFCKYCKILKNTCLEKHVWTAEKNSKTQLDKKKLAFSWCSWSIRFSLFLQCISSDVCPT